jgi:hypothetical protein
VSGECGRLVRETVSQIGKGHSLENKVITITIPLNFTEQDVRGADWPALKAALLDSIRSCYEDVINEEVAKRGLTPEGGQ